MTEELRANGGLPQGVVQEDRRLEAAAESTSLELAKHRWHWTDDESNPDTVSYAAYARAVGKGATTILQYAKGYVLFTQSGRGARSFGDALEQVNMSADRRIVIEAIANEFKVAPAVARSAYRHEVDEVRNSVEHIAEEKEEKGEAFPVEDRKEYAERIAKMKRNTRVQAERELEEGRQRHSRRFTEVDSLLSKARLALREAREAQEGVSFTDEEVGLLAREYDAIEGNARAGKAKLTGDSGTDWDAQLVSLEEWRQHG